MIPPDQYRREGAEAMREAMLKAVQVNIRTMLERLNVTSMVHDIDVDAVLSGLPPVIGGQSVVAVCPICDIELVDCQFTSFSPATDPMARLVEAARGFARWDHCWPGNINLEAACRDIREALAAMEANDDLR